MNPARGKVVVSTPRQWLTLNEIEEAFCSARLHLTKPQLYTLVNLVIQFSKKYLDGTYRHRVSIDTHTKLQLNPTSQSLNTALITSTIYIQEKEVLHSEWLKRYLVHLRVNSKTGNWNQWLTTKINQNAFQRKTDSYLMSEFHKALVGREFNLNDIELHYIIKKLEIIPEDILKQEINNRINEWIIDTNGTRDYSHNISRELKKYYTDNPIEKDEYNKIKNEEKKKLFQNKIIKKIQKDLIEKKKNELNKNEKKTGEITFQIFQKYNKKNKQLNYINCERFGDWLNKYIEKETSQIEIKINNYKNNNKIINKLHNRNQLFAPWNVIEYYLRKTIDTYSNNNTLQNELKIKLIKLKNYLFDINSNKLLKDDNNSINNSNNNTDSNAYKIIISKNLFLKYFNELILNKLLKIKQNNDKNELKYIHNNNLENNYDLNIFNGIFYNKEEIALKLGKYHYNKITKTINKGFKEWNENKRNIKNIQLQNEQNNIKKKLDEENKRKKECEKEYKKWLKLHNKNKYYSLVS